MTPGYQQPISTYDGWGVDPAYMTPAYMSNFRPSYGNNDNGMNPFANNYSVGESLNVAFGPARIGFGADPMQEYSAHRYNISTAPGDAFMSGMQNFGVPLASWYAMDKLTRGMGRSVGGAVGRGAVGAAGSVASAGLSRVGLGAIPRAVGAIGGGSALGGAAGAAGGFIGGFALPLAAGAVVGAGVNNMFGDTYVSTRRGMDAMRANSANQFISGMGGSTTGGFGMSASRSAEIAGILTRAGAQDFALETEDYNKIMDFSQRSGILNEMGNMDTKEITDAIKEVGSLVKLVSAITGDPDIQKAIEGIAALKGQGGGNLQQIRNSMQRLGVNSAVSGVSIDQLIQTIGNQGAMTAQQNGVRGAVGMLAAADSYAGFANAKASGLISSAQTAALGGIEGMTQRVTGGAFQAMSSPMGFMQQIGGSRIGANIGNTIQNFGTVMGNDAIGAYGNALLNQGAYMDEQIRKQGNGNIIISQLQAAAQAAGLDSKDAGILMAMAPSLGLDRETVRSALEEVRASTDPASIVRSGGTSDAQARKILAAQREQDGLTMAGVPIAGSVQRYAMRVGTGLTDTGARIVQPISDVGAYISDNWEQTVLSSKGFLRADEEIARVQEAGDTYTYTTEGSMEKELGNLNIIARRGNSDQKAASRELRKMLSQENLTEEDYSRIRTLARNIDRSSKGGFLGGSGILDTENKIDEFIEARRSNDIEVTRTRVEGDRELLRNAISGYGIDEETIDSLGGLGATAEIFGGLLNAGTDSARIDKFIGKYGSGDNASNIANVLGIEGFSDMSAIDREISLARSIEKYNENTKNFTLTEDTFRGNAILRNQGRVGAVDELMRNETMSTLLADINDSTSWLDGADLPGVLGKSFMLVKGGELYGGRDNSAELQKKLQAGNDARELSRKEEAKREVASKLELDTSGMTEIGKSVVEAFDRAKWGPSISENTEAMKKLTVAIDSAKKKGMFEKLTEGLF